MSGSRNSKVIREMMRKRDEVKGEIEEIRSNALICMDDHGMNGDSNLSHSVRTSKQGRQSSDDDTN